MQLNLLKIFEILKFYFSKKLVLIFLMGIVSGIPLYLILSTMMIWLTRENIDITKIGLFTLTQLPWSLKFLWAPIIDNYKIPIISNYMGKRKSWLLFTQFFLAISIITLGFNDPSKHLFYTAIIAFSIAFFSATQDIIIDALRIELLDKDLQGAGAAMTQAGYRIGGIIAGAGALYFREIISWQYVFVILGLIVFLFMVLTVYIPENQQIIRESKKKKINKLHSYLLIFIEPVKEFLNRNGKLQIFLILSFIFLFKLGDVIAGVMANPFYVKIGFSNIEIANASKLFGVIATLVGVFIGGYLVKLFGILKVLIIGGFLQILSNLLFVFLANIGPNYIFLVITVAGENISGGLGSAGFVAYLSILCNKNYTATQYAMLSSIMGVARTILSSPSGYLVNSLGWSNFFLVSSLFGVPGIIILFWMIRKFKIHKQVVN